MFEGLRKKFADFANSLIKKEKEEIKKEEEKIDEQKEPRILQKKEANPDEEKKVMQKETHLEKKQERGSGEIKAAYKEKDATKQEEKKEQKPPIKKEEKEFKTNITTITKIKSIFFKQVEIKEKDVESLLEEFKISLLESDVNYEVTEKFVSALSNKLVGMKVDSKNISGEIKSSIRDALFSLLSKSSGKDIVESVKEKKSKNETPYKVLFIGPNGAGKTTTIAKIAKLFLDSGFTCIISASDTFRAAAIEQTVIHANRLNVGVIKGSYGADPASIAFDAIASAKAHKIDVVLIDSAGRQETNKSLVEEIKKMARVAKPDLKIFIGEGIAGNSLIGQIKEFNTAIELQGVILTKLDCDAKGGNTITILSETEIPVLYFGTGEGYGDLLKYNPEIIVDNIVPK